MMRPVRTRHLPKRLDDFVTRRLLLLLLLLLLSICDFFLTILMGIVDWRMHVRRAAGDAASQGPSTSTRWVTGTTRWKAWRRTCSRCTWNSTSTSTTGQSSAVGRAARVFSLRLELKKNGLVGCSRGVGSGQLVCMLYCMVLLYLIGFC